MHYNTVVKTLTITEMAINVTLNRVALQECKYAATKLGNLPGTAGHTKTATRTFILVNIDYFSNRHNFLLILFNTLFNNLFN